MCLKAVTLLQKSSVGKNRANHQKQQTCPNRLWQHPGLNAHPSGTQHRMTAKHLRTSCFLPMLTNRRYVKKGKSLFLKLPTLVAASAVQSVRQVSCPNCNLLAFARILKGYKPLWDIKPLFSWQKGSDAELMDIHIYIELCQKRARSQDFTLWLINLQCNSQRC